MKRVVTVAVVAALVAGSPTSALAYLKFGLTIGSNTVDVVWRQQPVRYFVTERPAPEVSVSTLVDAVNRAFATWQAVPTANLRAEFQGLTVVPPGFRDGRTTIGFLDRPDLDRVLGATSFLIDSTTGEVIEADIFLNTRFPWSTAPGGDPGRTDVESVVLHEIGHLLGLGHSAIGETEMLPGGRRLIASGAVMFPIAMLPGAIADRVLQPDDIAGISDLYPAQGFEESTGSISGRVTRNGQGVFGAHVVAVNVESGAIIGGFALNDRGDYTVAGLPPGAYIVRAEPLDDVDVEGFFDRAADLDFRAGYAPRVVIVPEGGGVRSVDIAVRPK